MKQKTKLLNWLPSGILALILAGSTNTAFGVLTDWLVDDFSEGNVSQVSVTDTGPSGNMVNNAIVTYDGTVGKPAGSCYVDLEWPASNGGGWEDCKIDWGLPGWPGTDITAYQSVDFDLKVDVNNSTLFSDGTYGGVQVIPQSWTAGGWYSLGGATIQNSGNWQHITVQLGTTLPVPYPVNRLNISFYSNPPENALGPVKFWIDNVTIKAPPVNIPPPTVGTVTNVPSPVTKAIPGLNVLEVTEGNGYWDRQSLELMTSTGLSWVGRTGSGPVTYSFSIVGYPNSQNCEAYMFLVPNAVGNEGSADWNEANVICAELQGGPNNATFSFNIKTDATSANPALYASLPYSTVYGKWTVKFTSDTSVTLIAPDNVTQTNFSISADQAAKFAESSGFNIYLGMQANQLDGMNQPVVFGNFAVAGAGVPSAYSENFLAESVLNTTTIWRNSTCSQPLAAFIVPSTGADWLSWTIPDTGFSLEVAPAVDTAAIAWNGLGGSIVPLWGGRMELVSNSDLPSGNTAFFRLVKRVFTKLQILLPGMTAAPNTENGYSGSPTAQQADADGDYPFPVIVNAVDDNWNPVNATGDTIQLTSTDSGNFLVTDNDLGELALSSGGTVTFTVVFLANGSATITATDVDDGTKTAATSPTVTY